MNVQNISIKLDKGIFEVTYISDSGTLLYDTFNLSELKYYIGQLVSNGSGTGFFQMLLSADGNTIAVDKNGTNVGNTLYFIRIPFGLQPVPLDSAAGLTTTDPGYFAKGLSHIVYNPGDVNLTGIKFTLPQKGSGVFATDYSFTKRTGAVMGAVSAVDNGAGGWAVTIASFSIVAGIGGCVLITDLV